MKLKRITYDPNSLSHHNENIQYWVTQGITIDGTHYSIEEYFVRDEVLYAIVSEDKRTFYEYPIADLCESKTEELKKKINALENRKDNYVSDVAVAREGDTIKLTYTRIDGTSSEISFTDHDTVVLAYDDTELRGRVTILEAKEDKDTIYDDTEVKNRITALESKEDKDTIYNDTEVKGSIKANEASINALEGDVTALRTHTDSRLEALENKEDKDTVYDDTDIKSKISALETKVDGNKSVQDDKNGTTDGRLNALEAKDTKVESGTDNVVVEKVSTSGVTTYTVKVNDTDIKKRIQALEEKPDKDTIYDDTELKSKVTELDGKVDTNKNNQESKNQELEGRISALETKEDKDTIYDDTLVKARITALEEKPDKDTIYDDTELKGNISGLRTSITNLKNENANNDEVLKSRIEALENKPDKDTVYDDSEVKSQINALTGKVEGNKTAQDGKNTELENRIQVLEVKPDKDTVYDDTAVKDAINHLGDGLNQAMDYTEQVKNYVDSKADALTLVLGTSKADSEAKTLALTNRVNVLEEAKPVVENKLTEIEAKNTSQDEKITALENRTDNFINNVTVSKEDGKVKLTYSRVDGSSSEVEFEDSDTVTLAYDDEPLKTRIKALEDKEDKDTIYNDTEIKVQIQAVNTKVDNNKQSQDTKNTELENRIGVLESKEDKDTIYDDSELKAKVSDLTEKDTALEGRIQALETKPDKDTVYDDTALAGRVTALEAKEDKDTVYDDTELKGKVTTLEGKATELTEKDTALEGRIQALETKPEVEYDLVKDSKIVPLSQGEGVINLEAMTTTEPLKELVLTGNVSAKVKSPFGGEETTVAGKVGFNSGATGDAISGSQTTAVSENVYVEFYYTDSTVKAYLVYEPENENEVVKYRKALSLAELEGTEPARISISKANVEQGYVEATFTAVTASSNSYKVQKKG